MMETHDFDDSDFKTDESITQEFDACKPSDKEKSLVLRKFSVRFIPIPAAIGSNLAHAHTSSVDTDITRGTTETAPLFLPPMNLPALHMNIDIGAGQAPMEENGDSNTSSPSSTGKKHQSYEISNK